MTMFWKNAGLISAGSAAARRRILAKFFSISSNCFYLTMHLCEASVVLRRSAATLESEAARELVQLGGGREGRGDVGPQGE